MFNVDELVFSADLVTHQTEKCKLRLLSWWSCRRQNILEENYREAVPDIFLSSEKWSGPTSLFQTDNLWLPPMVKLSTQWGKEQKAKSADLQANPQFARLLTGWSPHAHTQLFKLSHFWPSMGGGEKSGRNFPIRGWHNQLVTSLTAVATPSGAKLTKVYWKILRDKSRVFPAWSMGLWGNKSLVLASSPAAVPALWPEISTPFVGWGSSFLVINHGPPPHCFTHSPPFLLSLAFIIF